MISMKHVEKMDAIASNLQAAHQILADCGVNSAKIWKIYADKDGEICQIIAHVNKATLFARRGAVGWQCVTAYTSSMESILFVEAFDKYESVVGVQRFYS